MRKCTDIHKVLERVNASSNLMNTPSVIFGQVDDSHIRRRASSWVWLSFGSNLDTFILSLKSSHFFLITVAISHHASILNLTRALVVGEEWQLLQGLNHSLVFALQAALP